ncbi:phycobiliprotein lyase [Trichormus variabilis]|uniref:Chromophore lyase CpcS/CpeS n=1 Tax=Trichormus variabilis SAG 1403-4b TaxID=447716 RepID=A0A433UND5_ANAVA|nr:phycobiliprotein lyase [Trichormus variabilis]MBD2626830.1 phycobiliprotein lyase [Trichormus variabilis FACHB-164]RUS95332.1 chromophore lyase CpcS/CpeS [Trichormus variabilis SAG 1403-4b]
MNIEEFFELSAGKWFSHRTSHHLAFKQSEDGKSDIVIEMLAADHPEVIKLCEQYEIQPSTASCGARVTWNGTMEWDEEKHQGSTVLATVPDADNPDEGKLLREMGYAEKAPVAGSYKMGNDGALTLITEYETMWSEERLWFASPNLRMRVSVLKRFGGFSMASFTSEIRVGSTAVSTKATEAANAVQATAG